MCGAVFEKRSEFGSGVLRFEHWDAYKGGGDRKGEFAVIRGGEKDLFRGGGDRNGESGAFTIGDCSMVSRARAG